MGAHVDAQAGCAFRIVLQQSPGDRIEQGGCVLRLGRRGAGDAGQGDAGSSGGEELERGAPRECCGRHVRVLHGREIWRRRSRLSNPLAPARRVR
jgi:hypothetical protein